MIVTFDDRKTMSSETLRMFKDSSELPHCSYCGSKLNFAKEIKFISCNGTLSNGQRCSSKNGSVFKEVFIVDDEKKLEDIKAFSKICQYIKKYVKEHSHFNFNASFPIKFASHTYYDWDTQKVVAETKEFINKNLNGTEPYASDIFEIMYEKHNTVFSENDLKQELFSRTNDERFLPQEAKDLFIF